MSSTIYCNQNKPLFKVNIPRRVRNRNSKQPLKPKPVTYDTCFNIFLKDPKNITIPQPPNWVLQELETIRIIYPSKQKPKPRKQVTSNPSKPINGFILFRSYYSRWGYGIKQTMLSQLLAKFWKSSDTDQALWDYFALQYSCLLYTSRCV